MDIPAVLFRYAPRGSNPLHITAGSARRHKVGCHELDGMAMLPENTGPMMRTGARFHADEARWQLRDQCRQLIARHTRLDQYRLTRLIHTVNGEYIPGKIDSDSDNRHGLPLSLVLINVRNFIMVRRCRLAASAAASGQGSPFHSLGTLGRRFFVVKISLDATLYPDLLSIWRVM